MKKVLTFLLVAVMALTLLALLPVYASDNLTPNATDASKWSGWTDYQGGYRRSVTGERSDGTEGTLFDTGCATDGAWHTITVEFEYTDEIAAAANGVGHYLYFGSCENWWSGGDWLEIASIQVFELEDVPVVEDNMLTDSAIESADTFKTPWTKGWVDPATSVSFSNESHTLDGTGSIRLESQTLNMHFSRPINLEAGHTYKYSGWMKVSDNYQCSGAGSTGAFMSITPIGGSWGNRAGMALDSNKNNSTEWTRFEGEFTADETKEYLFSVVMWGTKAPEEGTSFVWFDELAVVDTTIIIPEADPDDLLGPSGLGNPAYILANEININAETWVGHEDWNTNQGWDGFRGNDKKTERIIVKDILPDGTEGWALKIVAPADGNGGSETAIENIDKICGFVAGHTYQAVAAYKTSHAWCNGHELCFGFSKNCTHGDQTFATDGAWHTITVEFEYTDEIAAAANGVGHYLYFGSCENWWSEGDWLEIASVQVFDITPPDPEEIPEVEGNLIEKEAAAIAEGTTLTAGWGDSPADTPAAYGFDAEVSKTFDGTGSAYITLGVKKHQILNVATVNLLGGHTYEFSGWIKTSDDFATDGHGGEGATLTWGDNMPSTGWITTAADWTYVTGTYTPEIDGAYTLQFRIWGATTSAWVDEVAVVDVTPEPEPEEIPEVEGNLIEKEAAAIAEGTTLTAGWGDSPAESPAEYGYDAVTSKTYDGTGSAYIKMRVKKHQILNVATVDLIGGHTYEFSGWIKTSDDFATDGHGGEGTTLTWGDNKPSTGWITTAADWTYVTGTYTPETDGAYTLQFRIWGATTEAWVDEVAVVDVTPADQPIYENEEVEVYGEIGEGTATIEVIEIKEEEIENIEIVLPKEAEVETVVISKEVIEQIAELEKNVGISIETSNGTVALDENAMAAVIKNVTEATFEITSVDATIKEADELTEAQQQIIEEKEPEKVVELEIIVKGEGEEDEIKISDFEDGIVTVSFDFEIPEGKSENDFGVFYIDDEGNLEEMPTEYKDGKLFFQTSHFSTYVVLDISNAQTADAAIIAVIAIVTLIGMAVVVLKRKENA